VVSDAFALPWTQGKCSSAAELAAPSFVFFSLANQL
jgi:hypothetical protein